MNHGEAIADKLSSLKAEKPSDMAARLESVNLKFNDALISDLAEVAKCETIEGVQMSNEELDALKDAAKFDPNALLQPQKVNSASKYSPLVVESFDDKSVGQLKPKRQTTQESPIKKLDMGLNSNNLMAQP